MKGEKGGREEKQMERRTDGQMNRRGVGKKSLRLQHDSEKDFTRQMRSPVKGCLLEESHLGQEWASSGTFAVEMTPGSLTSV